MQQLKRNPLPYIVILVIMRYSTTQEINNWQEKYFMLIEEIPNEKEFGRSYNVVAFRGKLVELLWVKWAVQKCITRLSKAKCDK